MRKGTVIFINFLLFHLTVYSLNGHLMPGTDSIQNHSLPQEFLMQVALYKMLCHKMRGEVFFIKLYLWNLFVSEFANGCCCVWWPHINVSCVIYGIPQSQQRREHGFCLWSIVSSAFVCRSAWRELWVRLNILERFSFQPLRGDLLPPIWGHSHNNYPILKLIKKYSPSIPSNNNYAKFKFIKKYSPSIFSNNNYPKEKFIKKNREGLKLIPLDQQKLQDRRSSIAEDLHR